MAAQRGRAKADDAVTEAQENLAAAKDTLAALSQDDQNCVALSVAVTGTGGTGHLTVTHHVADPSWSPVCDISLDRKAGKITVDRGVLVSQYSGQDWVGRRADLVNHATRRAVDAQRSVSATARKCRSGGGGCRHRGRRFATGLGPFEFCRRN